MHEMGFGSEAKQQERGGTAAAQQHGDAADKRGGGGTNRTKRRNKNATMRRGKMSRSWGLQGKLSAQRVLERSLESLGRGATYSGPCAVQCGMRPVAAAGVSGGRGPCLFRAQGCPGMSALFAVGAPIRAIACAAQWPSDKTACTGSPATLGLAYECQDAGHEGGR
jgi:hypothetical protein